MGVIIMHLLSPSEVMILEYLQGEQAARNGGTPLEEGQAFILADGKFVKQEIIDHFDFSGAFVYERPTGFMAKLIVNLYKVNIQLLEKFNEHVSGIRLTDNDDNESFIDLALIPASVQRWDGIIEENFYISERWKDNRYSIPSKRYLEKVLNGNKEWINSVLRDEQSN